MKKGPAKDCTDCNGKPKKVCVATTFVGKYCEKCMKVIEYMDKVTVKNDDEVSSEQKIKKDKSITVSEKDIKKIEKLKPKVEEKKEKGGKQLNIGL